VSDIQRFLGLTRCVLQAIFKREKLSQMEPAITMTLEAATISWEVDSHSIRRDDVDEDQLLLERAKQGDHDAFGFLTQPHLGKLFKSIWRITRNREDAEDSMQAALIRAFTHLEQFRGASRFSVWLISIGINQALMNLRSRHKKVISLDSADQADSTSPSLNLPETRPNPEQQYRDKELAESLNRAINRLPSKIRAVFELRYVHEFSTEQVAMALGISIPAVKSRALRARRLVRERISGWQERESRPATREYSRLSAAEQAGALTL
jgi:RNA polymerase sigma-70 factor, ECF subfamily